MTDHLVYNNAQVPQPIFIIGAPRSGTSIMTWAVGQHPNIQPMPETIWIAEQSIGAYNAWSRGSEGGGYMHLSNQNWPLEKFMSRQAECVDNIVHDIYEARCVEFYGDFRSIGKIRDFKNASGLPGFHIRRAVDDPKSRWVDGTPANSFYLWGLLKLFPNAKFIHNLRSPLDVVKSLIDFDKAGGKPLGLAESIHTWKAHAQQSEYLHSMLGDKRVFLLDFDRIKNDREALLNDIFNFLGESPCKDANDVFRQRINSSDTSGKKHEDVIKAHPDFKEAFQFYENVKARRSILDSKTAADQLKQQFLHEIAYRNSAKIADLPFGAGHVVKKVKHYLKRT